MSDTLDKILRLIRSGQLRISEHGYDEIADEGIMVRDLVAHVEDAVIVEDYPEYGKGPCALSCREIHGETPSMLSGE